MSELRDLYQEIIIDHSRSPRNRGKADGATNEAEGFNPLCGDRVTISLRVVDGVIEEVRFQGSGCAISTAAASLLTNELTGKTTSEARAIFERYVRALTSPMDTELDLDALGDLAPLAGVREFPVRVKCATLAWHTAVAALDDTNKPVTTE